MRLVVVEEVPLNQPGGKAELIVPVQCQRKGGELVRLVAVEVVPLNHVAESCEPLAHGVQCHAHAVA